MTRTSRDTDTHSERQTGGLDLQRVFYSALEHKWAILGCLLFTTLLGVLYIVVTPKTYEATTVVQVEQQESKFVKIDDINTQDLKQAEILKTIETNLSGSALLLGVIQSLKITPEMLGAKPNPDGTKPSDNELVEILSKRISIKLIRGTRLINVSAQSTSPVLAQQIADEIIKEYARINSAQRAGLSTEANKFLLEEAERLKRQVQLAEGEAQAFKDQHPDVALENSQSFIDQKLLALNGKLNEAKEQRFKLQSDFNQVKRLLETGADQSKAGQLLSIPSVNTDPGVLQLQKSVSEAEATLREVSERYLPKHPKYIQAQAQFTSLQKALVRATLQAADGVGTSLQAAHQTEDNFEAELKVMEKAKVENDKLAIPYNALMREVDANRELFEGVRLRLKETEVTREIDSSEIRVVTPAMLPRKPAKPKSALVLVSSILGGLMLGACAAYGLSAVDTSFKTVDAAEAGLGLAALTTIPIIDKLATGKRFLITEDPAGAVAEAFRTLRTSLSLEIGDSNSKIILFTSSVPGEGKSFCAANYAISLAQLGHRTLLIDGDLRMPTVAKTLLKGASGGNGIQSYLAGDSQLEESYVPARDIPNLFILPSGKRHPNPAEILAGEGLTRLMKEAAESFDRIVVDSAPVHAVSDTFLLVKHVQSVCLVVQIGKTPAKVVERACRLLENADAKPAGMVLNRVSQHGSGYYYSYSAGKYGKGVYGAAVQSSG